VTADALPMMTSGDAINRRMALRSTDRSIDWTFTRTGSYRYEPLTSSSIPEIRNVSLAAVNMTVACGMTREFVCERQSRHLGFRRRNHSRGVLRPREPIDPRSRASQTFCLDRSHLVPTVAIAVPLSTSVFRSRTCVTAKVLSL
jgi:hypothetical protein